MKKLAIAFIFLFLFSINFISSVPPVTTVSDFPNGYVIVEAQQPTLKINQNHTYYFFLYNASNGKKIDNSTVNCSFYLANDEGNLLIEGEPAYQPNGYWYREIDGSLYLNETGFYSYGVNCQNDFGGALAGNLIVTQTGKDFESPEATAYLIIVLSLIILLLISGYGTIKIPYKNPRDEDDNIIGINDLKYLKIVLFAVSYGLLAWLCNLMIVISNNYIDIGVALKVFEIMFRVLIALARPIMFIAVIAIVINAIRDFKKSKELREIFG